MLNRIIIIVGLLVGSILAAWGASSTLSGLQSGGPITGTDLFYDVQTAGIGGVKVTGTQFLNFVFGQVSGNCTANQVGVFTCSSNTNTSIAAGTNITTSGVATNTTINVIATPTFTSVVATGNLTAGTASVIGNLTATTIQITGSIVAKVRSSASAAVTASATTDYFLCLDATSATITVGLPASPATGLTFLVKDCTGQGATHGIILSPSTGNIDGASNSIMTRTFGSEAVTYTGTQWSVN